MMDWKEYFYYDETSPSCLRWATQRYGGKDHTILLVDVGDIAGGKTGKGVILIYGQMPIGEMPINLVLLPETQEVVFVIVRPFNTVYDMSTDSMDAYFDMESFDIGGNSYFYNSSYDYKELPDMLKWLQQQKLLLNELTIYKGI